MLKDCKRSCNACPKGTKDAIRTSDPVSGDHEKEVMGLSVLFGERQDASGPRSVETLQVVQDTIDYLRTDDFTNLEKDIQDNCGNRHALCSFWAMIGKL